MKSKQNQPVSSQKRNSQKIFLSGNILTSLGILLVTVGGSWDITNHLLNKPETFFSPPLFSQKTMLLLPDQSMLRCTPL